MVVLPYLEPLERLLLLLRAPRGKKWYKDFLSGPSGFLRNRGVTKTVYVTRGEKNDIIPPPKDQEGRFSNESRLHLDIDKMEDDLITYKSALGADRTETEHTAFKKDGQPLALSLFWQFIFYVSPKPDAQIDHLRQCVENIFPGISLENILRDEENRRVLAAQYREAFRTENLNNTCLACIHGPLFVGLLPWCGPASSSSSTPLVPWLFWSPLGPNLWHRFHFPIEEFYDEWIHEIQHRGLQNYLPDYTFLMGDLSAGLEWERLISRFQNYLQRTQTFQVPHHGARSSWANSIPQRFPGALFIISAGLKNHFGHPHPEVLESLSDAGLAGNIRWVNEITPAVDFRIFPLPT